MLKKKGWTVGLVGALVVILGYWSVRSIKIVGSDEDFP